MKKDILVLLLTGYLGSGKTTVVNKILNNRKGIKFAVIVNDIGEVNIDADLIEKGGGVGQKDDSLVALQNGGICCTLKMDLIQQLHEIIVMQRFDYIVIEASGICEPEPIAQTICSFPDMAWQLTKDGIPILDCRYGLATHQGRYSHLRLYCDRCRCTAYAERVCLRR